MYQLTLSTFLSLLILIYLAQCDVTVTTTESDVSGYCSGVSYGRPSMCNITCSTCQSSSYKECSSCQNNFTLSQTSCSLSNNSYTYIYLTYFTDNSISVSDLSLWSNHAIDRNLGLGDIVSICSNSSSPYRFQMIGLFGSTQKIKYAVSWTNEISYITIKFNLLILINNVDLTIYLGEKTVYSKSYTSLTNLTATYYKGNNSDNYLYIPTLTSTSVTDVMQAVQVDLAVSTTSPTIYITLTSGPKTNYWALSDFTILFRECNTCVTSTLTNTISTLGLIIGYTSAFLFPAFIIFFLCIKLMQYYRLDKRQRSKGGRTVPMKAIWRFVNILTSLKTIAQRKANRHSLNRNSHVDRQSRGAAEQIQLLKLQNLKLTKMISKNSKPQ